MQMNNSGDRSLIVAGGPGVTLIGPVVSSLENLTESLAHAPILVAVDGGLDHALDHGLTPHAVIGDLDSASPDALAALDPSRVHHVAEQETTDFEKAVSRISAPLILAEGFRGGRIDHELAVLSTLLKYRERPIMLLSGEEVAFHAPPRLALDLPQGMRVSLFPLMPVQGRSRGLRWPIDDLVLAPGGRIGTSNETVAERVELEMAGPGLLVILPRRMLDRAITALREGIA